MKKIIALRKEAQPTGVKTGGSTFKNPIGNKAWKLIDRAGCRGFKVGGAMISEKHCNFIINSKRSTAQDIEDLGEHVKDKVKKVCGIELSWEIKRIGTK
jgi:UDP-N-acetylmuramate dehydrogenase